jgi:hypothetical protein
MCRILPVCRSSMRLEGRRSPSPRMSPTILSTARDLREKKTQAQNQALSQ